jgi:organic hydroperoxide reductase OsmC/OhrA
MMIPLTGREEEGAMADDDEATVSLELRQGYQFLVDFGIPGVPGLLMDEPEPLGAGQGPNASRVLAAAIADCLSASLLFCLRKARVDVRGMRTDASAALVRDERGRLRVDKVSVRIHPELEQSDSGRIARCLGLFEDFCVVTQSVRSGLDVSVEVEMPQPTVSPE